MVVFKYDVAPPRAHGVIDALSSQLPAEVRCVHPPHAWIGVHFCWQSDSDKYSVQIDPLGTFIPSSSIQPANSWLVSVDTYETTAEQSPVLQSPCRKHVFVGPHGSGQIPPQSTSVSFPSLTPLSHETHTPESHCALAQSVECWHLWAVAHLEQTEPPQSISVSPESKMPLAHDEQRPPALDDVVGMLEKSCETWSD